ncbi:hypothetical protein [Streptomyces sp. NPDC052291]|uniref:hypothetical protein n=1 Tax=Streptomyces sp. NPDC052291 TaxID=3161011 RepID=UPI0034127968
MHAHGTGRTPAAVPRRNTADRAALPAQASAGHRAGAADAPSLLALQRSAGNAAVTWMVQRALGGQSGAHGRRQGTPVQRSIVYAPGAGWARTNLPPDRFAALLERVSGEKAGSTFSIPYQKLYDDLQASSIETVVAEGQVSQGARAHFDPSIDGDGGTLRITQPEPNPSAAQLREFAATVTHEMQHALDSVTGRFKSQEKPQTMKERRISTELRAFGREAAAALKLALGDSYDKSQGKLSTILKGIPGDRITDERRQLAYEFHMLDSYNAKTPGKALDAFDGTLEVKRSKLLERVAGYLYQYELVTAIPTSGEALKWLRGKPEVVKKGLEEGIALFHSQRPQLRVGEAAAPQVPAPVG